MQPKKGRKNRLFTDEQEVTLRALQASLDENESMPAREEIAQYAAEMGKTHTQLYNWFYNHRPLKIEPGLALGIKEDCEIRKEKTELAAPKDGEVGVLQGKVKIFLFIYKSWAWLKITPKEKERAEVLTLADESNIAGKLREQNMQ